MWRGSIHSSRRLTTSPLPPPSTPPDSRMIGNSARSITRPCASSRAERSSGSSLLVVLLVDAVPQLGGFEHGVATEDTRCGSGAMTDAPGRAVSLVSGAFASVARVARCLAAAWRPGIASRARRRPARRRSAPPTEAGPTRRREAFAEGEKAFAAKDYGSPRRRFDGGRTVSRRIPTRCGTWRGRC